eukprot:TRINITY_DN51975_c0_g2_i1.p1 TRINITY_DN51975_c0_g2~~TRINITY_DN51975_c0_g2_i1.p1  ORF type:complete len:208 (-),score=44.54 TRINITY_DN51975_c0_g2_i1:107-730(-)
MSGMSGVLMAAYSHGGHSSPNPFLSELLALSPVRELASLCFVGCGVLLLVVACAHYRAREVVSPGVDPELNTLGFYSCVGAATFLPAIAVIPVDPHELPHHIVSGLFLGCALLFIQFCCKMDQSLPDTRFGAGVKARLAVLALIYIYGIAYMASSVLDPRIKPTAAVLELLLFVSMLVFWGSLYPLLSAVEHRFVVRIVEPSSPADP